MQRMIVVVVVLLAAGRARAEPVYVEPSFSIGGLAGVDHALHAGRVAIGFFGERVRGGGFVEANDLVDGGFGLGVEVEADLQLATATRLGLRLGAANGLWDRDHPTLLTLGPRVRYADLVSAGVDVMLATEVPGGGGPALGGLATVRGEGKGGLVVAGAALLVGAIVAVGFAATDRS